MLGLIVSPRGAASAEKLPTATTTGAALNGEADESFDPTKPEQWDLSRAVPLIIPKGSLVLLHYSVVHYSEGNTSHAARHTYSIHVIDGAEGCYYASDNWLQRPADVPFRIIKAGGGAA